MLSYIGWDNRFLVTLRTMITGPAEVILAYLNGIGSRYMTPLVFVGLGVAVIAIMYNVFSEEYMQLANSAGEAQLKIIQEGFEDGNISQKQYESEMDALETNNEIQKYFLKYFNIISFLFLPIYAMISRLIFGSRFNYGEFGHK